MFIENCQHIAEAIWKYVTGKWTLKKALEYLKKQERVKNESE